MTKRAKMCKCSEHEWTSCPHPDWKPSKNGQTCSPRHKSIAPKKSKPVKVKAWAHPDIFTTGNPMAWVAKSKSPVYSMPVTITGERKYLGGNHGKR